MQRTSRVSLVSGLLTGLLGLLFAYVGDAAAQLSKDDAKCINAMNKNLAKVASTMGKDVSACIKNFGKGKLTGTAEDCLTADVKGKVAKAAGKTSSDFTKKCVSLPAFGVTDPNNVNDIAIEKELLLVRDIFGSDLDRILSTEKDPSKCQQAVIKSVTKCQDAYMKSYNSCKKNALKASVSDPSELAACIGDDAKGKIAKACGKISGDVTKKCSGQDLAALFHGCGVGTTGELTTCLETAADCRSCVAIKNADGLDATCSACIPSGPLGSHVCTYATAAFCVGGPNDGEPCDDPLGASTDCAPGGNCLEIASALTFLGGDFIFDLPEGGLQTRYTVGTPDPVTGLAPFDCELIVAPPLNFGPLIGVACLFDAPVPNCETIETIDCDGGTVLDRDFHVDHNIGDCGLSDDPNETDPNNLVGPSECVALCGPFCEALPGDYTVFKTGCEGYCRFGDKEGMFCSNDVDCQVPNPNFPIDPEPLLFLQSGECIGGEPVAHRNRCQCECQTLVGKPSNPGDFVCDDSFLTILEVAEPCDKTDPTSVVLACSPRTSAVMTSSIIDNNAVEGVVAEHPPFEGRGTNCSQLAAGNLSTQIKVGVTVTLDGGLGDQQSIIDAPCE